MIARFLRWLFLGASEVCVGHDRVDAASQRLIKAVEDMQAELKRSHK